MSRYSDQIRDEYGRTVPKVSIYVYKWDAYAQVAGDLETLTDDLSAPLGNPLTSDPDGLYYFNSVDGQKLIEYHYGGKVQLRDLILVGALPVPQAVFGGLLANASALSIPTGMDAIGTTGADALDHGGANYVAGTAPTPRSGFTSANVRNFVLSKEQTVTPQMFYQAADANLGTAFAGALAYLASSPLTGHGYGVGTPKMAVPAGPSVSNMGTLPVDMTATTHIEGEGSGDAGGWSSALSWGANSHGFRVQFVGTSGDTAAGGTNNGGTGSIISGLALNGAFNGTTVLEGNYHGIFLRARASLRDLNIWNWQGDGIHIHAGVGLPEYGNASNWEVRRAWIQATTNGIFVDGSDSNQGICYGVQVSSARQWGFYDYAGIQNLYIAPLTQLCGYSNNDGTTGKPVSTVTYSGQRYAVVKGQEVGASTNAPSGTTADNAYWYWYQNGGVDAYHVTWFSGIALRAGGAMTMAGGTILHGYTEADQPPCQFGTSVLRVGGTWGNKVIGGAFIFAGANQVVVNDLRVNAGGVSTDDDQSGAFYIGRFSAGAGCAIIRPTVACSYLAINSPDNTQMLQVANAGATVAGAVKSSHATAGVGYATGAGGAVTQATSRTTGVTLNKVSGAITLFSAAGTATWQTFTVTNSTVAATDVVRVVQKSGTDKNMIHVTAVAAGSFDVTFATTGGTTVEAPVFNFAVIKAVAA